MTPSEALQELEGWITSPERDEAIAVLRDTIETLEAHKALLREQVKQLKAVLSSSNRPSLCQCSQCRDICEEFALENTDK